MKDDPDFTDDELALMAELVNEVYDNPEPTRSPEEVDRHLDALYERTVRERRKIA